VKAHDQHGSIEPVIVAKRSGGQDCVRDVWRRRPDDYRIALDRLETPPFALTTARSSSRNPDVAA
jgi:hypothetical protein